jgi:diadenosine tetraphosphate (Ap4A) HIT family hydrolase
VGRPSSADARVTLALTAAFQPNHFNYAFLQNQDQQVHLHIIPRYAASRTFAGETFEDSDYPDHYRVPASPHMLSKEQLVALTETIQGALPIWRRRLRVLGMPSLTEI